jgi:hypothetical protein
MGAQPRTVSEALALTSAMTIDAASVLRLM